MPTVVLSPIGGAGEQFLDNNGNVLSGGKIYTYAAGTTTPLTTYTSLAGTVANANPVVLNSAGRVSGQIWLIYGASYKFVIKDSLGNTIDTQDNISGSSAAGGLVTAATIAALKAMTGMTTGTRVLAQDLGFYRYDSSSSTTAVGSLIVTPDSGTGRWFLEVDGKNWRPYFNVLQYGAVGDGATDDTAAMQATLDAAALVGGVVAIPPGTYKTTATLFINQSDVTVNGYGATIVNATNTRGVIAIVPTGMTKTDAAFAIANAALVEEADMVQNVRVNGITGTMMTGGSGSNLGFMMLGAINSSFRDCIITESNGNAFNLAQTIDCEVVDCKMSGHNAYGIFVFESLRCRVLRNYIEGGSRGIAAKMTYDGNLSRSHLIDGNTLVDIDGDFYWIVNGEFFDVSGGSLYPTNHEWCADDRIINNVLRNVSGAYTPCVTIGVFAHRTTLRGNVFYCNDVAGQSLSIGSNGNYTDGGTVGENHMIVGNSFVDVNASGNAVIGAAVSAQIIGNRFTGAAQRLLLASTSTLSTIKSLVFNDNFADLDMYLATTSTSGIVVTTVVDDLEVTDNILKFTSATSAANSVLNGVYTSAVVARITGNIIRLVIGSGVVTHATSFGIYATGTNALISGNHVKADAATSGYSVYVNAVAVNVSGNVLEEGATATTTRGIHIQVAGCAPFGNQFVGSFTSNVVDVANGTAIGVGRLLNLVKSIAPSSVAANTSAEQTYTVQGLSSGETIAGVTPPASIGAGLALVAWRASGTDTLALTWGNFTAGPLTPPTGTYRIAVVRAT